jgi:flagellar motor switch protein FliG
MPSLNKLKTLKDAEIQHWLTKVEKTGVDVLVKALLGADEAILERVLRNMSEAAGKKLSEKVGKARALELSTAEVEYNAKRLEVLF